MSFLKFVPTSVLPPTVMVGILEISTSGFVTRWRVTVSLQLSAIPE